MRDEYHTVSAELRGEIERIKGSRFLATVAPVGSPEAAGGFLTRIREEFADATHNCWAWRIGGEPEVFRSSDDGEPGGSAGRPILQQIEGHELTDTAVVVTRWFGGTKLGVGGLMRAYGGAAGHALDAAGRRLVVITRRLVVEFPYECTGAVEGLFASYEITPAASEYGASVRLEIDVPRRRLDRFMAELRDRTAGRVEMRETEVPGDR
jgi:uncharacterized YigZ family protein